MSRKLYTVFLIVLVLALTIAACGQEDEDDDTTDDQNTGDVSPLTNDPSADETSAQAVAQAGDTDARPVLSASYTSEGAVSFDYPAGWAVQYQTGYIRAVSSEAALTAEGAIPGQMGLMIVEPSMIALEGGATPGETLVLFETLTGIGGAGTSLGVIIDTTVDGQNAARMTLRDRDLEGLALAIEVLDNTNVLVFGMAYQGEFAEFEPLLLDIAATITYSGPPAP